MSDFDKQIDRERAQECEEAADRDGHLEEIGAGTALDYASWLADRETDQGILWTVAKRRLGKQARTVTGLEDDKRIRAEVADYLQDLAERGVLDPLDDEDWIEYREERWQSAEGQRRDGRADTQAFSREIAKRANG